MPEPTPVETLKAAADRLRHNSQWGATLRAGLDERLADLLDHFAYAHQAVTAVVSTDEHYMMVRIPDHPALGGGEHDHRMPRNGLPEALAVARVILGKDEGGDA
jgi:hypothetical protein